MSVSEFLHLFPDVQMTNSQRAFCLYLESKGQRFCVDFGYENSIEKAWELMDLEDLEMEVTMMMKPRLATSARVAAIRAALARVNDSREHYRLVSADPAIETLQNDAAKEAFCAAVKEFGWQWANVEAVLDALAPEEL